MKLLGGTHFLISNRLPSKSFSLKNYSVNIFNRYDEAIQNWKPGTSISPIFSIDSAKIPKLDDELERHIFFIGPIFPNKVSGLDNLFLTLGLYNVIAITENKEQLGKVQTFIEQENVNWEEWVLIGSTINEINMAINDTYESKIPKETFDSFTPPHAELMGSTIEYRAQVASLISQFAFLDLPYLDHLVRFDVNFRKVLKDNAFSNDYVNLQGLITIANSTLARYSSQTIGGASPILESKCSISSNSLLGVGIASFALQRLSAFILNIFSDTNIAERIISLKKEASPSKPLYQIIWSDSFWEKDHLFGYESQQDIQSGVDDDIPLITSFSGKDGFRSTELSLSAPVASISGCNTVAWTLLTITHEISHLIVQSILGILLKLRALSLS